MRRLMGASPPEPLRVIDTHPTDRLGGFLKGIVIAEIGAERFHGAGSRPHDFMRVKFGSTRSSFAQHGDNHGPFTGTNIAFDVKDLLPSAEHGLAVAPGHRQARSEQRRLQVGMAVAVVPSLLVGVISTGWNKAPQERRQVLLQAGLEFDGADRTRAAHVEDLHDAGAHTRLADNPGDRVGQVVHLAGAMRV